MRIITLEALEVVEINKAIIKLSKKSYLRKERISLLNKHI